MTEVTGASGPDEQPVQAGAEAAAPAGPVASDSAAPTPSEPGQPTQAVPAGQPWSRWAIAAVATFVVVGAALAAFLATRPGGQAAQVAALVPAGTVAYAEVTADPPGDQRALLLGLLQKFPGFEDQSRLGQKIDETITRLLSGSGVDYERQVKPWLGSSAAVAVWPAERAEEGSVVVFLASRDDAAAQALIDDRAQAAARSGGRLSEETYRDVAIVSVTERTEEFLPNRSWAAAVYRKHLLVGSTAAAIKGVVDVGSGAGPAGSGGATSLADTQLFKDAMAALPAERIAASFANQGALFEWVTRIQPAAIGPAGLPFEFTGQAALAGSLRAETDSAVLDLVPVGQLGLSRDGVPVVAPTAPPDLVAARASRLDRVMPADALMSADIHDLGPVLRFQLDTLSQTEPELADQLRALEQALAFMGLSLDDVLGAVGDAGIVMTLGQGSFGASIPGVGLVAEVRDQATAQRVLDQLNRAMRSFGLGGEVTTEQYRGVTLYRLVPPGGGDPFSSLFTPTYGLSGDLLIIALDSGLAHAIVDVQNGAPSLASNPDYQAVMGRAGAENSGAFFFDVAGYLEVMRQSGAPIPDEAAAFIEPIAAIGFAVVPPTSGSTGHVRMVVLIK